jgi:hypothetical protein
MHRVLSLAMASIGSHSGQTHEPLPGVLQTIPALGVRAIGSPAPFIVAALAIDRLLSAPDPAARAKVWVEFGDAPLDIVAREVR